MNEICANYWTNKFIHYKPKPKERKEFMYNGCAIAVVEDYYDNFSKSQVDTQLIVKCSKNYKHSRRGMVSEGMMIKKAYGPYIVNIFGFYGNIDIDITDKGAQIYFDRNSGTFGIIIRFNEFPTKDELIAYLAGRFWIEQEKPASYDITDTGRFPIWDINQIEII